MSGLRVSRVGFSGDAASATLRSPKQALGSQIRLALVIINAMAYSTAVQRQNLQPCACELPQPCSMTRDAVRVAGGVRRPANRKEGSSRYISRRSSDLGAGLQPPALQPKQKGPLCTRLRDAQRAPKLLQPRCGQQQTTARARPERAALGEGAKSHFVSVYSKGPKRPRAHANRHARHARRYARHRATRTAGTDGPRRLAIA